MCVCACVNNTRAVYVFVCGQEEEEKEYRVVKNICVLSLMYEYNMILYE